MSVQDESSSFANALRQAMEAARMNQAALARAIGIDASQVNRWVRGRSVPQIDNLHRIEATLKVDLSEAFAKSTPEYELFVSAPFNGLANEAMPGHHDEVAKVVDAARQHVNGLYWPGEQIRTPADVEDIAPDIFAERNLRVLHNCPAFLYLQFDEVVAPTSAYIELGFALGIRMKVTMFVKQGLVTPFMLRSFSAVAAELKFLPKARMYTEVRSADQAASLIAKNGREMLGLL